MDHRKALLPIAFTFLICLSSACGLLFGQKVRVQMEVARTLNQNSPVAVDVVLIYDDKLLKEIQKYTAKDWFEKREQLIRDSPKGLQFDLWGWELVPGQSVSEKTLYVPVKTMFIYPKARVLGGVVFANYATPGPHRFSIAPGQNLLIRLQEKGFTVEPQK